MFHVSQAPILALPNDFFLGLVIRKNFKKEASQVLYEGKTGKQRQRIGEKKE